MKQDFIVLSDTDHHPRLRYILRQIIEGYWGCTWTLTQDRAVFEATTDTIPLNLSGYAIANALWLPAGVWLSATEAHPYTPPVVHWEDGLPAAFKHPHPTADLSFAVWDWCFYQLSRYEEYQAGQRDAHGRFSAEQSLAHHNGFLHIPVVDAWIERLAGIIQRRYPLWKPRSAMPAPALLATYDIDYAYAYRCKGWLRQTGAMLRHLLQREGQRLRQQWAVWRGRERDPYDTFDYLDALHTAKGIQPRYFWLVGNYGKYDKNCLPTHPAMQTLLRRHAERYTIGWHPSYRSNDESLDYAKAEKERLEQIIGKEIRDSRQHFLRLSLPHTYRRLLALGIQREYSMGYADAAGFRAGTARPFVWYDLSAERETTLTLFPFVWMDVMFKNYLQRSPQQAITEGLRLRETALRYGFFSMIWHNNSLCEAEGWQGWRRVLEELL